MQTSYASPASGRPGLVRLAEVSSGLVNKESSAAIPFGRMVQFSSSGAKILSSATDVLAGIVVFEHDYDRNSAIDSIEDGPKAGVLMTVLQKGVVMVQVEGSTAFGDRPYVRYASSGGNTRIGGFAVAAGTGLRDVSGLGMFLGSASADGYAPLLINVSAGVASPLLLGAPSISVGSESSNTIDVTVTIKQADGSTTVAAEHLVEWWISDAAKGAPSASIPSGGVSVQTGTEILAYAPDVIGRAESSSGGVLVLRLTESGAHSWYLNVNLGGRVYSSAVITFA